MFSPFTVEAPKKGPTKRNQQWSRKPSSNKPNNNSNESNKTPISRAERNIKNSILEGIAKRVIKDKEGSNNNKMPYDYYPKLIKEYITILPWLNHKNIKY